MSHYTPYQNPSLNGLYDMLFCDNMEPYQANNSAPDVQPWATLFSETPEEAQLLQTANDTACDTGSTDATRAGSTTSTGKPATGAPSSRHA